MSRFQDEWNEWYSAIYVPNYEKVPGVIRGRRFRAVVGEPKYLTVYEFEHEKVPETQAWRERGAQDRMHEYIGGDYGHAAGSPGVYHRILPPRAF